MQFKAFYNDWLDCSGMIDETGKNHVLNLNADFFKNLKFDSDSLKQYRIDAATRCAETLGERPALCFSGGVDSQAMIQCWLEADLKFDVIIGIFNDGLNRQDSDHAKLFCEKYNIPYKTLNIDIVSFLNRNNMAVSDKYRSISPHFNTHYYIVELLAEQEYSGTCFGGIPPFKQHGTYGSTFTGAPMHFLKIQSDLPIPLQGSFLSFSPELTWAITLMCEELMLDSINADDLNVTWEDRQMLTQMKYNQKVDSFIRTGFHIIPQEAKYTGFELVKDYYAEKSGDGWTFERRFRHPIVAKYDKDNHPYKIALSDDLLSLLNSIHSDNFRAG
jgi:hypothetical protein